MQTHSNNTMAAISVPSSRKARSAPNEPHHSELFSRCSCPATLANMQSATAIQRPATCSSRTPHNVLQPNAPIAISTTPNGAKAAHESNRSCNEATSSIDSNANMRPIAPHAYSTLEGLSLTK